MPETQARIQSEDENRRRSQGIIAPKKKGLLEAFSK
jgi:hypothetical protein